MTIRSQYYELTKDMPAYFNFLILYYSPDRWRTFDRAWKIGFDGFWLIF